MKIYVDADACPVKNIIVQEAKKRNIPVVMICDTSHIISDGYSENIVVDKCADSADFALVNLIKKGDVAVTQDYGVAAMAMSKGAKCINQNGVIFDEENMSGLLFQRFLSAKVKRSGGKIKGPSKRSKSDDENFRKEFLKLIE